MGRFSNLEFGDASRHREEDRVQADTPRDEHFYLRLADEQYRAGWFEKALRHFSRVLEFNPNVVAAWFGQVQMLIELGEYKEARLWADKALEIFRDHPDLLSTKTVVCAREGDLARAIAFSDAALQQKGITPYVWLARGEALLAGFHENQDYCFLKADTETKDRWFTRLQIGRIFYYYGEYAKAMSWMQEALSLDVARPFLWAAMGDCQGALGLLTLAEKSYRQALSIDGECLWASKGLIRLRNRGVVSRAWTWLRDRFK
jgi:tetratricopeptide (TPR) repeat protein